MWKNIYESEKIRQLLYQNNTIFNSLILRVFIDFHRPQYLCRHHHQSYIRRKMLHYHTIFKVFIVSNSPTKSCLKYCIKNKCDEMEPNKQTASSKVQFNQKPIYMKAQLKPNKTSIYLKKWVKQYKNKSQFCIFLQKLLYGLTLNNASKWTACA